MLRLGTARRTIAMAAATLAVAGGTIIAVGGAAHAAPASCTIINIGAPGSIYVGSEYAGQVEQQYNSCGSARAHFQYSYSYWVNHRGDSLPSNWSANLCLRPQGFATPPCNYSETILGPQDAYTDWVPIHNSAPDTWQATVNISLACGEGYGSWHAYASGANWGNSDAGPC
ncbi:hypothetical protein ACFV2H_50955 [Streptomyces sp. NPDC059629]|uniref:hypothetical protein n=1 Tax=Streptomyces sp. NPDC059629 TaxID=3346889 RepID=UPI0036A5F4A5